MRVRKATGLVAGNWDAELGRPAGTVTIGGESVVGTKESRKGETEDSTGGVFSTPGASRAVGVDGCSSKGKGATAVSG